MYNKVIIITGPADFIERTESLRLSERMCKCTTPCANIAFIHYKLINIPSLITTEIYRPHMHQVHGTHNLSSVRTLTSIIKYPLP